MQVRVPWTQAWLCTKDFRRKCTGAGVAAKVAVPSNAAQRGGRFRRPTGDFFGASGAERRQTTPTACTSRKTVESGKQSRRRQDQRYRVAVVVFATMLQVCRLPARSAVDSLAEGEERDAEELG
ncbi:hypothetical protein NDU88_006627 [Pleurodeles waltl]|uniref:Uncharacterized protein n=1 Tax=Pleurodeles waltl TaxID=8319 RepID=A0AAV7N3K6_PLEWA|nr:hypothetical protein NDU88_006627 [Pleurodeles waltl]